MKQTHTVLLLALVLVPLQIIGQPFVGGTHGTNKRDASEDPFIITDNPRLSVLSPFAKRAADAFDEFLNFDDNQIPAGWHLIINGPGVNAQVANQRFEVGQVDTYASLESAKAAPAYASAIEVSHTGNIADVYWGMGSQIQFVMANGKVFVAAMGKGGFGGNLLNFVLGAADAPLVYETEPAEYGTYRATVTIRHNQIDYQVVNQSDGTVKFGTSQPLEGLDITQLSAIRLFAVTTTGETAWMDDVSIKALFPRFVPRSQTK